MSKELLENYKQCQKAFLEKKLKESSFSELIKPAMNFLDTIHTLNADGDLSILPPLEDDKVDVATVLSTSEKDISPNDGTLVESTDKSLQEDVLQEKDRSYAQIVADYAAQGGTDDFEKWRTWIETQPDAAKARVLNKSSFKRMFDLTGGAPAATTSPAANPVQADPDYKPSETLSSLIDICHANENLEETALTTVTDKYDTIELLLRRVVRGKSAKRYYILAGDPGIGKTYIASKILQEEGIAETSEDLERITHTGSIGRSQTSIATFLWQHRDDKLIVLDDCDSFLRKGGNLDVVNILKGCMEAGTHYRVGISQNIAQKVTNALKESAKAKVSDKVRALFESEDEEIIASEEIASDELDTTEVVPTSWTFNARMIILSNLHESQIEEAIWSRCDHYDLHLTQEEYLVRLGMILDRMDVGQNEGVCTPEEAKEAKAVTFATMQAIIEAGNHGVKLFGKNVRLSEHLEFRIVKDLVNSWLAHLERELELNPKESRDEAKAKIMPRWVRINAIPRMSAHVAL